jgi:hypothetical protein
MMYKYEPQVLQQLGMQQQPFDPSAGIGEFERRQFQPYNQPEPFDPSAGIGEFEAKQLLPYRQNQAQPQALQQMGMRQQSYQPLPQAPSMQPFLQQFKTQQRPYQSPYQNSEEGGRSGSAYSYNNNSQLNNLAPLNMNALNFSY